jgi:hypothetical protein
MFVTYDFCGIRGSYSTEIIFQIDCDGSCVPIRVRNIDQICYEEVEYEGEEEEGGGAERAKVSDTGGLPSINRKPRLTIRPVSLTTLHGSLHIETTQVTSELSDTDRSVIRATLAKEFSDAAGKGDASFQEIVEILPQAISTLSSSLYSSSLISSWMHSIRQLKLLQAMDDVNVCQIDFKVSLVSENYGVDASIVKDIDALAGDLFAYLHHSMNNGLFISKLRNIGRSGGFSSLMTVKTVHLAHLIVVDKRMTNETWLDVRYITLVSIVCIMAFSVLIVRTRRVVQLRLLEKSPPIGVIHKYDTSIMYTRQIHDVITRDKIDKSCTDNYI